MVLFKAANHPEIKKFLLLAVIMAAHAATASAAQLPAYDCGAQVDLDTSECQALVALYTSTNDLSTPNPWTNENGWLVDANPCSWFGVSCADGHLSGLSLSANNLRGSLPAEIGNFSQLSTLEVNDNSLNGPLPASLKNLTNLTELDLSRNSFSGTLPKLWGNLAALISLNLGHNSIEGEVPISYANLINLNLIDTTGSNLCLPNDPEIQSWYYNPALTKVNSLPNCPIPPTPTETEVPITSTPTRIPLPTLTATPTVTATATATPTLLGQFQTLTVLAEIETLTTTANWTASATEVLPSETATSTVEPPVTPPIAPEEAKKPSGEITPFWWVVLGLALVLISIGILMELKRQKVSSSS